jgi:hypothetical protein
MRFSKHALILSLLFSISCTSRVSSFRWGHLSNDRLEESQGREETRVPEERLWRGVNRDLEIRVSERHFDNKEKGDMIFLQESLSVQSHYTLQPVPYAGPISAKVSCREDLLPRAVSNGDSVKGYLIPSNERLMLGLCDRSQVTGNLLRLSVQCAESKTIYVIKIFAPGQQEARLMNILDGFQCSKKSS